jgi:hypothetical protein
VRSSSDIAGDLNVVGLVSQDEMSEYVAFRQSRKKHEIGRVAVNDAVRPELENIADPSDCNCSVGLERPQLQTRPGRRQE